MDSSGCGDNNSYVILLGHYYASFDVLQYVAYEVLISSGDTMSAAF